MQEKVPADRSENGTGLGAGVVSGAYDHQLGQFGAFEEYPLRAVHGDQCADR